MSEFDEFLSDIPDEEKSSPQFQDLFREAVDLGVKGESPPQDAPEGIRRGFRLGNALAEHRIRMAETGRGLSMEDAKAISGMSVIPETLSRLQGGRQYAGGTRGALGEANIRATRRRIVDTGETPMDVQARENQEDIFATAAGLPSVKAREAGQLEDTFRDILKAPISQEVLRNVDAIATPFNEMMLGKTPEKGTYVSDPSTPGGFREMTDTEREVYGGRQGLLYNNPLNLLKMGADVVAPMIDKQNRVMPDIGEAAAPYIGPGAATALETAVNVLGPSEAVGLTKLGTKAIPALGRAGEKMAAKGSDIVEHMLRGGEDLPLPSRAFPRPGEMGQLRLPRSKMTQDALDAIAERAPEIEQARASQAAVGESRNSIREIIEGNGPIRSATDYGKTIKEQIASHPGMAQLDRLVGIKADAKGSLDQTVQALRDAGFLDANATEDDALDFIASNFGKKERQSEVGIAREEIQNAINRRMTGLEETKAYIAKVQGDVEMPPEAKDRLITSFNADMAEKQGEIEKLSDTLRSIGPKVKAAPQVQAEIAPLRITAGQYEIDAPVRKLAEVSGKPPAEIVKSIETSVAESVAKMGPETKQIAVKTIEATAPSDAVVRTAAENKPAENLVARLERQKQIDFDVEAHKQSSFFPDDLPPPTEEPPGPPDISGLLMPKQGGRGGYITPMLRTPEIYEFADYGKNWAQMKAAEITKPFREATEALGKKYKYAGELSDGAYNYRNRRFGVDPEKVAAFEKLMASDPAIKEWYGHLDKVIDDVADLVGLEKGRRIEDYIWWWKAGTDFGDAKGILDELGISKDALDKLLDYEFTNPPSDLMTAVGIPEKYHEQIKAELIRAMNEKRKPVFPAELPKTAKPFVRFLQERTLKIAPLQNPDLVEALSIYANTMTWKGAFLTKMKPVFDELLSLYEVGTNTHRYAADYIEQIFGRPGRLEKRVNQWINDASKAVGGKQFERPSMAAAQAISTVYHHSFLGLAGDTAVKNLFQLVDLGLPGTDRMLPNPKTMLSLFTKEGRLTIREQQVMTSWNDYLHKKVPGFKSLLDRAADINMTPMQATEYVLRGYVYMEAQNAFKAAVAAGDKKAMEFLARAEARHKLMGDVLGPTAHLVGQSAAERAASAYARRSNNFLNFDYSSIGAGPMLSNPVFKTAGIFGQFSIRRLETMAAWAHHPEFKDMSKLYRSLILTGAATVGAYKLTGGKVDVSPALNPAASLVFKPAAKALNNETPVGPGPNVTIAHIAKHVAESLGVDRFTEAGFGQIVPSLLWNVATGNTKEAVKSLPYWRYPAKVVKAAADMDRGYEYAKDKDQTAMQAYLQQSGSEAAKELVTGEKRKGARTGLVLTPAERAQELAGFPSKKRRDMWDQVKRQIEAKDQQHANAKPIKALEREGDIAGTINEKLKQGKSIKGTVGQVTRENAKALVSQPLRMLLDADFDVLDTEWHARKKELIGQFRQEMKTFEEAGDKKRVKAYRIALLQLEIRLAKLKAHKALNGALQGAAK